MDSLIEQKLSQGSQKVQFSAHLQFRKPSQNEDQEDQHIEIYAKSVMTPVYSQGLSSKTFRSMIEKMTKLLMTFAFNGSGWVLEKVIKIIGNFARYRAITGSPYIALPSKLQNCRGLLNNRNHEDTSCSFTATLLHILCTTILAYINQEGTTTQTKLHPKLTSKPTLINQLDT